MSKTYYNKKYVSPTSHQFPVRQNQTILDIALLLFLLILKEKANSGKGHRLKNRRTLSSEESEHFREDVPTTKYLYIT
jgi:hypothetical protein